MLMVLQVGLTIKQSIRLGSLSLPTLAVIFWLAVLFRSTSTWISLEVTITGLRRDSLKVASWETRSGLVWRRRRGRLGFRSHCCWQPFRISFRLGELSRLHFKTQTNYFSRQTQQQRAGKRGSATLRNQELLQFPSALPPSPSDALCRLIGLLKSTKNIKRVQQDCSPAPILPRLKPFITLIGMPD